MCTSLSLSLCARCETQMLHRARRGSISRFDRIGLVFKPRLFAPAPSEVCDRWHIAAQLWKQSPEQRQFRTEALGLRSHGASNSCTTAQPCSSFTPAKQTDSIGLSNIASQLHLRAMASSSDAQAPQEADAPLVQAGQAALNIVNLHGSTTRW